MNRRSLSLSLALLILFSLSFLGAQDFIIQEEFADLANWEELIFPKIDEHSTYSLMDEGDRTLLKAQSRESASGLIFRQTFDVYQWQELSWRWKIDGIIPGGDGRRKDGDDYAIRIYVIFEYDPETARGFRKTQYNLARLLYGEYPPDSGLNYVWANVPWDSEAIPSAYSDRSMMIAKDTGEGRKGEWTEHSVNILEDYRKAFGGDPPRMASLAIMADSDNTGNQSTAYIDFIRLGR